MAILHYTEVHNRRKAHLQAGGGLPGEQPVAVARLHAPGAPAPLQRVGHRLPGLLQPRNAARRVVPVDMSS